MNWTIKHTGLAPLALACAAVAYAVDFYAGVFCWGAALYWDVKITFTRNQQ